MPEFTEFPIPRKDVADTTESQKTAIRTALGAAAAAALDTEAATRLAADNRRAFAGGVAFSSARAKNANLALPSDPLNSDWSVYIRLLPDALDGVICSIISNSGDDRFFLELQTNGAIRTHLRSDGTYATRAQRTTTSINSGKPISVVFVNSAGVAKIYFDGVEQPLESSVSSAFGTLAGITIGSDAKSPAGNFFDGIIFEGMPFNRALSAAEVSELSEIGLGAWLAVHPEDKWGGDTILADGDMEDAGLTDSGLWAGPYDATLTKSTDDPHAGTQALRITADGAEGTRGYIRLTNSRTGFKIGQRVRVSGWARGDGAKARPEIANPTASPTTEVWLGTTSTSWQFFSVEFMIASDIGIDLNCDRADAGDLVDGDWVEFDDLVIQPVGALAAYPMTEGNGRQLRDLSGRYDALLSETGYQHLQPKNEGYVRVKGADANPNIMMLSDSDIIPEDAVWTQIIAEERIVDIANTAQDLEDRRIRLEDSTGDLLIRRSDGSNHETLGTVTAPTDTDDVDVEVRYKQVIR